MAQSDVAGVVRLRPQHPTLGVRSHDPDTNHIVSPGKHQDTVLKRGELERARASPRTVVTDRRNSPTVVGLHHLDPRRSWGKFYIALLAEMIASTCVAHDLTLENPVTTWTGSVDHPDRVQIGHKPVRGVLTMGHGLCRATKSPPCIC